MIDGIKFNYEITNELDSILDNRGIKWTTPLDRQTGELRQRHYARYEGLELSIKIGQRTLLIVKGSIHKYHHKGVNCTPFYYYDLCNALDSLSNNLGISLSNCQVTNIEFGVNLNTANEPSEYYNDYLLHKLKPFKDINISLSKSKRLHGVQCAHTEVVIKAYDKGRQNQLPINLMRFEVKLLKMRPILKKIGKGQLVLSDLKEKRILVELKTMLISEYKKIFKVKEVNPDKLGVTDRRLLDHGKYSKFWIDLRAKQGKSIYDTKLKRFKLIQVRYGLRNCKHNELGILIESTYSSLLNNGQVFKINPKYISMEKIITLEIDAKSPSLSTIVKDTKKQFGVDAASSLGYRVNWRQMMLSTEQSLMAQRKCIICGKDISGSDQKAVTCSHRCRNKKSNAYNNPMRAIKKDLKTPTLFPNDQLLKLVDAKRITKAIEVSRG